MSCAYTFEEVEQTAAHAELYGSYEANKASVTKATTAAPLPSVLVMSTVNGFVQIASLASTGFRLFLLHLGGLPMEVSLRTLAIVATSGDEDALQLVCSLAHDNTLLLVSPATRKVETLKSFVSRPSALYSDGDFTICGDGCGEVSTWRNTGNGLSLLWSKRNHSSAVTSLTTVRQYTVATASDFTALVLDTNTGNAVTALSCEASAVRGVFGMDSFSPTTIGVMCDSGSLTVWSPTEGMQRREVVVDTLTSPPTGTFWLPSSLLTTDFTVSVATVSFGFMVVGGSQGQLAMFDVQHAKDIVPLCHFVVESAGAIILAHVTRDSHLLVATAQGDVWRWPLHDVLPAAPADSTPPRTIDGHAMADGTGSAAKGLDEEEEDTALDHLQSAGQDDEYFDGTSEEATSSFQPTANSSAQAVLNPASYDAEPTPMPAAATPRPTPRASPQLPQEQEQDQEQEQSAPTRQEVQEQQHDEQFDMDMDDKQLAAPFELDTSLDEPAENAVHRSGHAQSHGFSARPPSSSAMSGFSHRSVGVSVARGVVPSRADREEEVIFMDDFTVATPKDTHTVASGSQALVEVEDVRPPQRYQNGEALEHRSVSVDAQQAQLHQQQQPHRGAHPDEEEDQMQPKDFGSSQIQSGPIEGLKAGRRLPPEAVKAVLDRPLTNVEPQLEDQTTSMLERSKLKATETEFDPATYAESHKAAAEGFAFKHPIRVRHYGMNESVITDSVLSKSGVMRQAQSEATDRSGQYQDPNASFLKLQNDQPIPEVSTLRQGQDEMLDVTAQGGFKRRIDKRYLEGRAAPCPDIDDHLCEDLLNPSGVHASGAAIFFSEGFIEPAPPQPLIVPLSMAPTPPTF